MKNMIKNKTGWVLIGLAFLGWASLSLATDMNHHASNHELSVIAKKFDFLPKQIVVEQGRPVKIYLTSLDVTHGFAVKELEIDRKVEKDKLTIIEFTPNKTGEFEIRCSSPCGLGHVEMKGKLIV